MAERVPAPPDLERLRKAGIPTCGNAEFTDALRGLKNRRRQLLGMVQNAAYSWPPI